MPSVAMEHVIDPKDELLERVGDLRQIEIFGNDILVGIYRRPEKTKSGLILVDTTREEDKFQGKVMLILKMGPTCFLDEDGKRFRDISVNDWIVARPSDGWAVTLNSCQSGVSRQDTVDCRIIPDHAIRARVKSPDIIY